MALTLAEACAKMTKCIENDDPDIAHVIADNLLVEIIEEQLPGWRRICHLYKKVKKWYS